MYCKLRHYPSICVYDLRQPTGILSQEPVSRPRYEIRTSLTLICGVNHWIVSFNPNSKTKHSAPLLPKLGTRVAHPPCLSDCLGEWYLNTL